MRQSGVGHALLVLLAAVFKLFGALLKTIWKWFQRKDTEGKGRTIAVASGAAVGYWIGGAMGVAALGTAISGALPVAFLLGVAAWVSFNWAARKRKST